MARVLSPDDACIGVANTPYQGTSFDVTNPTHLRQLRAVGYTLADAAGAPARSRGRKCTSCGFLGFFARCKCGGTCEKV